MGTNIDSKIIILKERIKYIILKNSKIIIINLIYYYY